MLFTDFSCTLWMGKQFFDWTNWQPSLRPFMMPNFMRFTSWSEKFDRSDVCWRQIHNRMFGESQNVWQRCGQRGQTPSFLCYTVICLKNWTFKVVSSLWGDSRIPLHERPRSFVGNAHFRLKNAGFMENYFFNRKPGLIKKMGHLIWVYAIAT